MALSAAHFPYLYHQRERIEWDKKKTVTFHEDRNMCKFKVIGEERTYKGAMAVEIHTIECLSFSSVPMTK